MLKPVLKPIPLAVLLLLTLIWLLWPVYDFYAHRGKVAFLPFTETNAIPESSPAQQRVFDPAYEPAATAAISHMIATKQSINAPAISAAVAIEGEIKWAGATGWADIEGKRPATTNTQFRIGSTSKALTSVALARMVDQGAIDLNTKIANYFDTLPNENWRSITPRQLASHTAGLPHYKENTDYIGLYQTTALQTRYTDVEDALEVFDSSDLLFEPGAQFSYSSLGTVLLSATMQQAGNTPYLELVKNLVLGPLNLNATDAEYNIDDKSNFATFYWNNKGRQSHVKPWREVDLSHRLAGGGFISTPSDLVLLGSHFIDSGFVSEQTRQEFWTPKPLPDGTMPPHNYSVGWRVIDLDLGADIGKVSIANHGGVSRGSQSWLMVIPEYKMSVAVNINSNTDVFWDFGGVSMEIAKAFILNRGVDTVAVNEQ